MKLLITDRNGKTHTIEGLEGWQLMEVIKDASSRIPDLSLKAECGGACACATCHVYIDPQWAGKLPPPSQEETDELDYAFDVKENSRLACQILLDETLDGLRVQLSKGTEA